MYQRTDMELVTAAISAIASLAALPPVPSASELGHSVATGEQPHAQACILAVMQSAVLPSLSEAALRDFLDQLGDACRKVLAGPAVNGTNGHAAAAALKLNGPDGCTALPPSRVPQARAFLLFGFGCLQLWLFVLRLCLPVY